MKWYMPSWNGDLRLEVNPDDPETTLLWIEKPTDHELDVLRAIGTALETEGIRGRGELPTPDKLRGLFAHKKKIVLHAPLAKIGPLCAKLLKPGDAVLTAVKFVDGRVITSSGTGAELVELAEEATKPAPEDKKPEAAATVKRPTPSCPQCEPGSIGPAREVLLSFLTPEEHAQWAETRSLLVTGGLSGARYLLAHRNTEAARRIGRVCYDVDTKCVVHFHDRSVPPEEEILAAKLILEHREPWLRNEATMLGLKDMGTLVFKNPFGEGNDGVPDAQLTGRLGLAVLNALGRA